MTQIRLRSKEETDPTNPEVKNFGAKVAGAQSPFLDNLYCSDTTKCGQSECLAEPFPAYSRSVRDRNGFGIEPRRRVVPTLKRVPTSWRR